MRVFHISRFCPAEGASRPPARMAVKAGILGPSFSFLVPRFSSGAPGTGEGLSRTAWHGTRNEKPEARNWPLSCAICHVRKEKRFCPALHDRICPQCCGREREVTLDCPSTCEWLQQARQHERQRDLQGLTSEELFLDVEVRNSFIYDREPLMVGLTFALARAARADRSINDRDLIGAVTAMARSYQTLVGSGLHYETPSASLPQQAISAEVQKMIAEYRQTEEKHIGYATLKDSEVLQAMVFLVRMAQARTNGRPRSRAFVDFLLTQFPDRDSQVVAPGETASRLIVP